MAVPTIMFYHCPKTAGMAIAKHLGMLQQQNRLQLIHQPHTKPFFKTALKNHGIPKNVITLTTIRDPISHARSLYGYIKKSSNHHRHQYVMSRTFEQWIRDFRPLATYYTSYYGRGRDDWAKEIWGHIDFVLDKRTLETDFNKFLRKIGINQRVPLSSVNETPQTYLPQMTPRIEKLIRQIRASDFEIYKLGKERRLETLK